MKRLKQHITLLLFLCLGNMALAQDAALTGRVFDFLTGEPLVGATLIQDSAFFGASTDLEGRYFLVLPQGKQRIRVEYLGYADTLILIDLAKGATLKMDIALVSRETTLQGVQIAGTAQGQAKALNQQKNTDNIQNIVAADQIGRFPDPNAAEALQRVPGVSIERDQGEGRYVSIRGLAPKFTNVSVNGEQIPSPEAGVRFVALDAIPSDMLSSIVVSKTLTPDMDGDAIGGSVNLITRVAESAKPSFNGSAVWGYNALMGRSNLQGSLQYGQRFLKNQKLGVLFSGSYYSNNLGSDNWEREPFDNELELRDYELTRTRTGLSSTIDYKFNSHVEFYARGMYSRFTDREWRRAYIFISEDEEIEKAVKDRFESQSISTFNIGGKHNYTRFRLDYEFQYSFADQNTPYDNEVTFLANIPSTYNFGSNQETPTLEANGYLDNSLFEFDNLTVGNTLAQDKNITAKFNAEIPYGKGLTQGYIKFGGKVRMKNKSFVITQNSYDNLGGVPNLNAFEGGLLDNNFLGGKFQLSPFADMSKMLTYFNANPSQFELQVEDKAIDEAVESYQAREDVYAGYLMARQQIRRLVLIGGVRYESTQVRYESNDVVINPEGDLEAIVPVVGTSNFDYVLPSLNARFAWNSNTNIRAALTYSYARPNFDEIIPAQEANLQDEEATVGNANLRPVSAVNFDLLFERYFSNVGVLSGGVFYKQLDDFIYQRALYNSQYPLNTPNPIATGIRVSQAQNGDQANLLGFELAYQQRLTFLPGMLKNLNVYTNYTYTHSVATIQNRAEAEINPNSTEELTMPGQATHVGNAALGYENKKFTFRASLNFNSAYLAEIGGSKEEDLFVNNRMQLDLSSSYTLNKSMRVFAEVMNVTNQPFQAYVGNQNTMIQSEYYSFWTRFGVKFNIQ